MGHDRLPNVPPVQDPQSTHNQYASDRFYDPNALYRRQRGDINHRIVDRKMSQVNSMDRYYSGPGYFLFNNGKYSAGGLQSHDVEEMYSYSKFYNIKNMYN